MLCWLGASQLERSAVAWDAQVGCSIVDEAELIAASVRSAVSAPPRGRH